MQVTVYVKAGCSLCDDALELLHQAQGTYPLEVTLRDIASDLTLFQRYRYRVPVVCLEGEEALELRFSARALEAKLAAASQKVSLPPPPELDRP